MINFHGASH